MREPTGQDKQAKHAEYTFKHQVSPLSYEVDERKGNGEIRNGDQKI
jgi:hypothetical protein